jgi:spore germination cell wall hydrolase CwlJ-like protein
MSGFFRPRAFVAAALFLAALSAAPAFAAEAPTVPLTQIASLNRAPAALAPPALARAQASAPFATTVANAVRALTSVVAAVQRPLHDMVISFVDYGNQDNEQQCLAKAVYFEARGEGLEGQLAVAEVVLNRAASGRYPATICGVVTQPAQFSFIRAGRFPRVDASSACWHKALAIADIARRHLAAQIGANVLWYHADYVAPVWGRLHTRVAQIGQHIFYS